MFLRSKIRRKDGKEHRAWSVVENRRVHDGRVVQRQVLYLGEINDSQRGRGARRSRSSMKHRAIQQIALFPRIALPALDCDVVPDPVERDAVAPASPMGCLLDGYSSVDQCGWTSSGWRRCRPREKERAAEHP